MSPTLSPVKYARSGNVHIAYQVAGDGPFDLVYVPGFTSHLSLNWQPPLEHVMDRLASFSRLILFDKRGTGLSDPVDQVPTLEERMDDIRAVMDAAGSEKAAIFGFSEGGAMALLLAATHPERTSALVLWGAMARTTYAPDYTFAPTKDAYDQAADELILPHIGAGTLAEIYTPSLAFDPAFMEMVSRQSANEEQLGASPGAVMKIVRMYMDVDVRSAVGAVGVPTLIMHARGDHVVNVRHGRWLAEHMPHARYVELPGIDHGVWATDPDPVLDTVQEFLTGRSPVPEPNRVLTTVMFTDIVDSTKLAADLGDGRWRAIIDAHNADTRRLIEHFSGKEVNTTGDGFLATFDGPARGIRCASAIIEAVNKRGIEVRVGLHTGEVELLGNDIAGIAVHIASRIGSLAAGGRVLVSETVKGLVAGSGIDFEDAGEHDLKGVPDRLRLYTVAN